ncbi:MAG: hypothetical protein Q7U86_03285 [Draconibacterium sp.]|nr:hypothetical protein [Draconibacterium sp.]
MKTKIFFLILLPAFFAAKLDAQTEVSRDTMLVAAREIIKETTYCGLVTIDSEGQPIVRTMDPFPVFVLF